MELKQDNNIYEIIYQVCTRDALMRRVCHVVHVARPVPFLKRHSSCCFYHLGCPQVDVQRIMARDGCLSQYENDQKLVRDPQLYLQWTPIFPHPLPTSYEVNNQVDVHVVLGNLARFLQRSFPCIKREIYRGGGGGGKSRNLHSLW